jgi:NAD(P)-dependent dehydrogenase (short-subunit alcohol dehydrogenase family)
MMSRFSGRRALVTGGSDGIGLAIASALARNGASLWLMARDIVKLEAARESLRPYNVDIQITAIDLSEVSSIEKVAAELPLVKNQVDILINNAGVAEFTPFAQVSLTELDQQLNLNIRIPYLLTQKLLPSLTATKGCIINISSYLAQRMIPPRPSTAYSLTKGAVNSWTKALACELGKYDVRVNAIAPGTVRTPLFQENIVNRSSSEELAEFETMVNTIYPLRRIGEPDDLGGIVVYLASDEAQWVTGAIFNIDGGLTTN